MQGTPRGPTAVAPSDWAPNDPQRLRELPDRRRPPLPVGAPVDDLGRAEPRRQLPADAGEFAGRPAAYALLLNAAYHALKTCLRGQHGDRRGHVELRRRRTRGLRQVDAPAERQAAAARLLRPQPVLDPRSRIWPSRPTSPAAGTSTTSTRSTASCAQTYHRPSSCGCRSSRSPPTTPTARSTSPSRASSRRDWVTAAFRLVNSVDYVAGLGWFNLVDDPPLPHQPEPHQRPDDLEAAAQAGVLRLPARALSERLRVCFLTHYFPPEVGAPQTRIDLLARTLAARGVEVTVHTGFPHYPGGRDPAAVPQPAVAARAPRRDHDRAQRRLPGRQPGLRAAAADHAAFALSALATAPAQRPRPTWSSARPRRCSRPPPGRSTRPTSAPRYVVNVADRWPASAVELGALRNRRAIAAAAALERFIYRRADLIVAPTAGHRRRRWQALAEAGGKARGMWPVVDIERFDPRRRAPTTDAAARCAPVRGHARAGAGPRRAGRASQLAGPERGPDDDRRRRRRRRAAAARWCATSGSPTCGCSARWRPTGSPALYAVPMPPPCCCATWRSSGRAADEAARGDGGGAARWCSRRAAKSAELVQRAGAGHGRGARRRRRRWRRRCALHCRPRRLPARARSGGRSLRRGALRRAARRG